MTRSKRHGRHKGPDLSDVERPAWMLREDTDEFSCLYSLAEEVLGAKFNADDLHASEYPSAREPYAAAMKAFARMNNEKLSTQARSFSGTRAMRKFWDAKVAARRVIMRSRK